LFRHRTLYKHEKQGNAVYSIAGQHRTELDNGQCSNLQEQDSAGNSRLAQYRVCQYRTMKYIAGQCRTMQDNAGQCRTMQNKIGIVHYNVEKCSAGQRSVGQRTDYAGQEKLSEYTTMQIMQYSA
jgi:hypothetical protein